VGIIPCAGGRNAEAEARLTAAVAAVDFTAIRSLRRPPEEQMHPVGSRMRAGGYRPRLLKWTGSTGLIPAI